eukprot:2814644-Prorocentrum_lima.AAC.1
MSGSWPGRARTSCQCTLHPILRTFKYMDEFHIDRDWTFANLPQELQTTLVKCRPRVEAPA